MADNSRNVPARPPIEHAHHPPPAHIRALHKKLQKSLDDVDILDFASPDISHYHRQRLTLSRTIRRNRAAEVFARFEAAVNGSNSSSSVTDTNTGAEPAADIPVYAHSSVPGLRFVPSLLPPGSQSLLLTTLLTGALADTQTHCTNLHAFYALPHPLAWFAATPSTVLQPRTDTHRPLALAQALGRKLRWMTLGGQYDWTAKRYPDGPPPPAFPADVAGLVHGLFPDVVPQAAIVNLYSPGDQLAPHRDLAESVGKALVSISLGCAGVFVIGCEGGGGGDGDGDGGGAGEALAVRLNSGDAVVMDGESRWAWHSVPKVLSGSCPAELEQWDGGSDRWKRWMAGKRVNLNVRQMWDDSDEYIHSAI